MARVNIADMPTRARPTIAEARRRVLYHECSHALVATAFCAESVRVDLDPADMRDGRGVGGRTTTGWAEPPTDAVLFMLAAAGAVGELIMDDDQPEILPDLLADGGALLFELMERDARGGDPRRRDDLARAEELAERIDPDARRVLLAFVVAILSKGLRTTASLAPDVLRSPWLVLYLRKILGTEPWIRGVPVLRGFWHENGDLMTDSEIEALDLPPWRFGGAALH